MKSDLASEDTAPAQSPQPPAQNAATARLTLADALLDAAAQAQRAGSLQELVREHARPARWLVRRYAKTVMGTLGRGSDDADLPLTVTVLLPWLVAQLRPDDGASLEAIPVDAWCNLSSWRPFLAMASHLGFVQVPDFSRLYRRRSGESAIENLCGLWSVGSSTLYRTLERARHAMAALLLDPRPSAARRMVLREFVVRQALGAQQAQGGEERHQWHSSRAELALAQRDPVSALWHRWKAGDLAAFNAILEKHAGQLLAEPETEALVSRVAAMPLAPRMQIDFWLARGRLARAQADAARELRCYEQARDIAQAVGDRLLLGMVYSVLGRFHDSRDADRALACYQDSVDFLRDVDPAADDRQALDRHVTACARLAWLYLLRNDPRSKPLLDRAEALRLRHALADEVLGLLEQVWAEQFHRSGEPALSLEHRFRALNIFERLGDARSVLSTCVSISHDLIAMRDYGRATSYLRRILAAAQTEGVASETRVSAHLNLGAVHFFQQQLRDAIAQYRLALEYSLGSGLQLHAANARYNLAEAHYALFRDEGLAQDEAAGDEFVQQALAASAAVGSAATAESLKLLKDRVLGRAMAASENQLLPGEDAIHFEELAVVRAQRERLASPEHPEQRARAHLAIAGSYAVIAAKEREAALALIAKHNLQSRFTTEFDELRLTFQRELTREQQLADAWKQRAADLVDDTHRAPLISHLLREGSINKSTYAELGAVSPATASKHLGLLTERGLLVQLGKGPSTRYAVPG